MLCIKYVLIVNFIPTLFIRSKQQADAWRMILCSICIYQKQASSWRMKNDVMLYMYLYVYTILNMGAIVRPEDNLNSL